MTLATVLLADFSREFHLASFCKAPHFAGSVGSMAKDEKGTSAWYRVPTWGGSNKEIAWWTSSLNLRTPRSTT